MTTATETTKTVTLTQGEWDAIRCALICHVCDLRKEFPSWAEQLRQLHKRLKEETATW
jgi:hypothetical protein